MSPFRLPAPTGPRLVGFRDVEFVDRTYPVNRDADRDGRRLMARVWYPAKEVTGEPAPYFTSDEADVFTEQTDAQVSELERTQPAAMSMIFDLRLVPPFLRDVTTNGYLDPPIADGDRVPVLVFSHGGGSYVTQNTALMEDLASHGYIAVSVAHPGTSTYVRFPDGSIETGEGWTEVLKAHGEFQMDPEIMMGQMSVDVADRHAVWFKLIDSPLAALAPRWRDDLLATVDAFERGEVPAELAGRADTSHVAYFGMSFGGDSAPNAAHADPRAKAAVMLDGGLWLHDTFGADIRVPLLSLSAPIPMLDGRYYNEFFFESHERMGLREDISRIVIAGPRTMTTPIGCSSSSRSGSHRWERSMRRA